MYIERQLEKKFIAINDEYACVLLTVRVRWENPPCCGI